MSRLIFLRLALLAALLAGCAQAAGPAPTAPPAPTEASPPTAGPARLQSLRLDVYGEETIGSMPWRLAIEALGEEGYEVEEVELNETTVSVLALTQGDIDVTFGGFQAVWSAIAEGGQIVSVLDAFANQFVLTATMDIQTCADLDGKRVGVIGLNSISTAMLKRYLALRCPEAAADILVVAGQGNRRAALISGELDAAMQQAADQFQIDNEAPDKFHALVSFSDEFPGVQITGFAVRREVAEQYPETVKDIIRADILQRRRIQDAQFLSDQVVARVGLEPTEAQELTNLYLARNTWPVNGSFTNESVRVTLEFLQENAGLAPDLRPEDVADTSFLEAVLDEIGRQ